MLTKLSRGDIDSYDRKASIFSKVISSCSLITYTKSAIFCTCPTNPIQLKAKLYMGQLPCT